MQKACYRELRNYKYQLWQDYEIQTDIKPGRDIAFTLFSLSADGLLQIKRLYAWDGPSGPTIDTRSFMRGSLVHDALYQLMRLGALDFQTHRQRADEILREICLEDGMSRFRAWYVYQGVRWLGERNARPRDEPEVEIICAP
ncbi:MAG: DUF1353 domain-containing protein [Candidatus Sumerlaeota bacterium]|nr:DUF1353 domain-containing protein [Candidatus Sumerlaeota bacterium]